MTGKGKKNGGPAFQGKDYAPVTGEEKLNQQVQYPPAAVWKGLTRKKKAAQEGKREQQTERGHIPLGIKSKRNSWWEGKEGVLRRGKRGAGGRPRD